MACLMPLPERHLTLPVALLASPPRNLPPVLRDCLRCTQEAYAQTADRAARPAPQEMQDFFRWQKGVEQDLLIDTWQEAFDYACGLQERIVRVAFFGETK